MSDIPDEVKYAIHGLNQQAFNMNKDIVQKSATMDDITLHKDIYSNTPPPSPQPVPTQQPHNQPQQQPVVQSQDLTSLINRVTAVEKQITRFVTLIENRVAKNAKEINIRIKLND